MAEIEFVDQTVYRGQQNLGGMRRRGGQVIAVAEMIDPTGGSPAEHASVVGLVREVMSRDQVGHVHLCLADMGLAVTEKGAK